MPSGGRISSPSRSKARSGSPCVVQGSADAIARAPERRRQGKRPWGALGVVAMFFGLLPWRVALLVGAVIGFFAGSVLRIRRSHVEGTMRGAGISVADKGWFAGQMYRSLGASLAELLWLVGRGRWGRASALASLDPPSRAKLVKALARGRGVVLATGHTGNWEVAIAAIAEEWPTAIVAKPMRVGMVQRFLRRARESRGIRVIEPRGAIAEAREVLRAGGIVGMMIDQVPDRRRHSLEIDFLCGYCDVDRSPAALAALAGAPVVVGAAYRGDDHRQRLEVLTVVDPPDRAPRTWVNETTREATRVLDRFVHKHPREWMWLHRRWRKAPK
jgi:KDO2-lipid IV(A) lauroyltransferase